MKAVVLCGGLGTRLRPLTYEIPKVLIPIKGKPVLEHIFDLFRRENVLDITLSIGYMGEKIKAHFRDGVRFGLNISYIEESSPLGTAGALNLLPKMDEPFIVSNGDELKDIPIQEMLSFHKKNSALGTIALTRVENPTLYGIASLSGSRILEFQEKPLDPPSNLANAGFYILDQKILEMIPKGFAMLERDIFPKLAVQGRLFGFPFPGQWYDTGSMERWEVAIRNWKGI